MDVVDQADEYGPQLFYDGERPAVLMRQASKDVAPEYCLGHVEKLFGVPAFGLMARIKRYVENRHLRFPEEINDERPPFMAVKHAYCSDWEAYKAGDKSLEVTHLRAYFWQQETSSETLMCITHFAIKNTPTLTERNAQISIEERRSFLKSGCKYSDEKWQ